MHVDHDRQKAYEFIQMSTLVAQRLKGARAVRPSSRARHHRSSPRHPKPVNGGGMNADMPSLTPLFVLKVIFNRTPEKPPEPTESLNLYLVSHE